MPDRRLSGAKVSTELQLDNVMAVLQNALEGIYQADAATYLMTVHQITRVINKAVKEIEADKALGSSVSN